MKVKIIITALLLFAVSCSNDNSNVLQRLNEELAIVREVKGTNDLFVFDMLSNNTNLYSSYIIPSNALPVEYKQDGLPVLISGDITNNTVAVNGYVVEAKGNSINLDGKYNTLFYTKIDAIPKVTEVTGSVCGCDNPQIELTWLKELIQKAEDYTSPAWLHYYGCIWIAEFKGQEILVTNMMLGSGGVMYWVFDCNGNHFAPRGYEACPACQFVRNNHVYLDDEEMKEMYALLTLNRTKEHVVIYTHPLLPYCYF